MKNAFFNIHTHNKFENANEINIINLDIENFDRSQPCSIGIPPWQVSQDNAVSLEKLRKISKEENVVAIGEIGLDKRLEISDDVQLKLLTEQIGIAKETEKPIIFHCVNKYSELIALKKKLKIPNKCIIHGFRGNARLAQQLIHENFYLSFGEKIIYHPETVLATPLNRIFMETDASSCEIKEVYDIVGRIKQIEIKELKEYIEKNIHECFPTLVF